MRHSLWIGVVVLLLAISRAVLAAESGAGNQMPTNITAERMRYDAASQRVVFEGNVHVTRPDFELWAAKLTVFLEKKNKNAPGTAADATASPTGSMGMDAGNLERIVAEKNVRIQQETKIGTSGKATYTASDGKVVMEDNPVIVDGSNRIAGKIINFYTRDNRSEVIGGVKAAFTTSDKKDGQSLLPGRNASSRGAQTSGNSTDKPEKNVGTSPRTRR